MTAPDSRVGQVLDDKYRIEELIARGGMGLVYAARHRVTHRQVAIKLLRAELLNRPELVFRVSVEGRLAAAAAHPNVVQVLDAGMDAVVPYVVQERLHGEPLQAILGEPLSLRATVEALMPVINAVAHLHRSGLIHRDIKPSNIFLARDADGRLTPKLLDFGIAKALHRGERTASGIALGTPAYMAPEQALGSRALGTPTDVWSMATVFARCVTGELPFSDDAGSRTHTLRLRAADLACIPEPVARVVATALELEPSERPRDMAHFRALLLEALREVDATHAWPDETRVSYFGAPLELEQALFREPERARPESLDSPTEASVHVRPAGVQTQTIQQGARVSAARPMRWGVALVALTLLGSLILALRPTSKDARPTPRRADDIAPSRLNGDERTFTYTSLKTEPSQSVPDTAPEGRSNRNGTPPRRPPVAGRAAPDPSAAAPSAGAPVLGANRAPILE